jgi:hypothetical protein
MLNVAAADGKWMDEEIVVDWLEEEVAAASIEYARGVQVNDGNGSRLQRCHPL